jgi:hypothetical protein
MWSGGRGRDRSTDAPVHPGGAPAGWSGHGDDQHRRGPAQDRSDPVGLARARPRLRSRRGGRPLGEASCGGAWAPPRSGYFRDLAPCPEAGDQFASPDSAANGGRRVGRPDIRFPSARVLPTRGHRDRQARRRSRQSGTLASAPGRGGASARRGTPAHRGARGAGPGAAQGARRGLVPNPNPGSTTNRARPQPEEAPAGWAARFSRCPSG